MHRRPLLVLAVFSMFLAAVIGLAYLYTNNNASEKNQTTNEQANIEPEIAIFEEISSRADQQALQNLRNGQYELSLSQSMAVAEDDSYDIGTRLQQYNICIKASVALKNNSEADKCLERGIALSQTIDLTNDVNWPEVMQQSRKGAGGSDEG